MSIDTELTALADAIRSKTGTSGKLSISDMTSAVNNIVINSGSDIDLTGVTVTADKMLAGIVAVGATGEKVTGNIQTVTAASDGTTVTVPVGYIAVEQTFPISGGDIDFTGVTVTADKLLNGVVAIDKNGNKVTGTIQDGSVRQDGAEITVFAGYYATDQLIELPVLDIESIHMNGSDVVIPPGYNPEENYFVLPESDIYVDGGRFFAGQGYVTEDKEITIPDATVTETETSVTVSPGYVGEELNFELGTPGAAVEYGYIDANGKIQKLDLSGDTPVDSGTPVEMPIIAFATGQNEPAYDGGGGGGGNGGGGNNNTPTEGLVLNIPLKSNKASAETGQALTLYGNVTYSDSANVCSAVFSGNSSDYIAFEDTDLPSGDSSRTISMLVKRTASVSDATLFNYGANGSGTRFGIFAHNDRIVVGTGSSNANIYYSFNVDTWYCLTVINAGSTVTLYVNGERIGQSSLSELPNTVLDSVGYLCHRNGNPFTGEISELLVYDRVLTDAEIRKIYEYSEIGGSSGGGETATLDMYRCTAVNTADSTWSGKKIESVDGEYVLASNETAGLTVGGITPKKGKVYTADGLYRVSEAYNHCICSYPFTSSAVDVRGLCPPAALTPERAVITSEKTHWGASSLTLYYVSGSDDIGPKGGFTTISGVPKLDGFTIEFWQYRENNTSNATCLYFIDVETKEQLRGVEQRANQPFQQWFHHAFVRQPGSTIVTEYIDGVQVGTSTFTSQLGGPFRFYCGENDSTHTKNYVNQFTVFDIAKYSGNFTPPTAPYEIEWEIPQQLIVSGAGIEEANGIYTMASPSLSGQERVYEKRMSEFIIKFDDEYSEWTIRRGADSLYMGGWENNENPWDGNWYDSSYDGDSGAAPTVTVAD